MDVLQAGYLALIEYVTIPRVISLTIAFFLSGAIAQFMDQQAVLKYFGPKANPVISYLAASVSGIILAVCSCSVLPMFTGIRKKGAGIGPAITFLFAGPAVNVLAVIFTFQWIGIDIGFARTVGAVVISIFIGIIMFFLFRKSEEVSPDMKTFSRKTETQRNSSLQILFFLTLLGILLSGVRQPILTIVFCIGLALQLIFFFDKTECVLWCNATFDLAKKIVPLFLIGIFLAGMLTALIPPESMVRYMGNNSVTANAVAAVLGAFMYFATLTEVPIVTGFIELGMQKGPALALLLAGPSLSLPNMIVIGRVLGVKKTVVYVSLAVLGATLVGLLAGAVFLT